jgi:DNA (cytosine-5)-methyltransferase 1
MGYDTTWTVMGAADIGAPHQRDRMWIVAKRRDVLSHPQHDRIGRREQQQESLEKKTKKLANTSEIGLRNEKTNSELERRRFSLGGVDRDWWQREPDNVPRIVERNMGGMVDGVAHRVDRLKAIGNGQVPLCAASAWRLLTSI